MLRHLQSYWKQAITQLQAFLGEPGADFPAVIGMTTTFHQTFSHQAVQNACRRGAFTDGGVGERALRLAVLLPEMVDDGELFRRERKAFALEFLTHPHADDVSRPVHDEPQRMIQVVDGGGLSRSLHITIGVLCT